MSAIETFCDVDGNIVGYAIAAFAQSIDPNTCVASTSLVSNYYDKDFNLVGSSLPTGWVSCCCGSTAPTVVEEDLTNNSQVIPSPVCEGVLPDARILRELPVRWDTASKTYKAYDDGTIYNKMGDLQVVLFTSGSPFDTGASYTQTNVVRVFNPSNCRSAKFDPQVTLSISANTVTAGTWDMWGYVGYSINTPWVGVPANGPLPVTLTSIAGVGALATSTCMPVFYGGVVIPPGGYVDVAVRGELRARSTVGAGNTTLTNAIIVKYDMSTDV